MLSLIPPDDFWCFEEHLFQTAITELNVGVPGVGRKIGFKLSLRQEQEDLFQILYRKSRPQTMNSYLNLFLRSQIHSQVIAALSSHTAAVPG